MAPRRYSPSQTRNSLYWFQPRQSRPTLCARLTSPSLVWEMKHWIHRLPGLDTLRRYEAAWLPHDIFAGIVLATMLVPVGIAYAVASGLPGIYGLYATIVPLLAYA